MPGDSRRAVSEMASGPSIRNGMSRVPVYPVTGSRRQHDRVDLRRQPAEAWLIVDNLEVPGDTRYSGCQVLNLSYAGMCLQAEDLFEVGSRYRFILDLAALLGTEVEVTAQIIWKRSLDAGLCYAGAVFLKSSAPWLGPDED